MAVVAEKRHEAPTGIDPSQFPWSELGRDVVFVDIETSGGTRDVTRVIEVGLVRISRAGEIRRFESLVDPESPVTTTFVHGLSNADVEGAPTFAALWPRLAPWFDDALLIAHKADFERSHFGRELERLGGTFGPRMLCTLKLARHLLPERTGRGAHSLAGLQELYGLAPSGHAALADAESLAALFTRWCATEDSIPSAVRDLIEEPTEPWRWPATQGKGADPRPRRDLQSRPRRRIALWLALAGLVLAAGVAAWFALRAT